MPIDAHWLWCNCPKLLQRFDMSSIWDLAALPEQIKKRELNKHFLNNRFWFETYTMTINRFSVAHALWMPKTYALLGDRSARAVSGSALITVNKQIILFKYKPTVLKTYFLHVRPYVQKNISVIFFKKQILRYYILFQEFKRLVKRSQLVLPKAEWTQ